MKKIRITDRLHILKLLAATPATTIRDLANSDYIRTSLSNQDWSYIGISNAVISILRDLEAVGYCSKSINIYGNDLRWTITNPGLAYYMAHKNDKMFSQSTSHP